MATDIAFALGILSLLVECHCLWKYS
jgi:Na+/H+ antiporter NhaA